MTDSIAVPKRMVYNAVRNYIVNELGLSREIVLDNVRLFIFESVQAYFDMHKESEWFKRMVLKAVYASTEDQVRRVLTQSTKITVEMK